MYRQDLYKNILVIGGNVSGLAAASQAKRVNPQAQVTVLESGKYISYGSCGLPYYISGQIKEFNDIFTYSVDFFQKKRDIKVLTEHRVTGLDTSGRQVIVNREKKIGYDRLIICSGSTPRSLNIAGQGSENIFNFWNVSDTIRIKDYISKEKPKNAIIAGGGSIGLLMAEAFHNLGIKVTIIELAGKILSDYEPEISTIIYKVLALKGIDVTFSAMITSFGKIRQNAAGSVTVAKGPQAIELDTDFILLSAGVKPNTPFIENTSIDTGPLGSIKVNKNLQTSHINIFAAGDCAMIKNLVTGKDELIPTANNAAKTGRIAGANAAGSSSTFEGSAKTKTDVFFGIEVAKTGINTQEAQALGYDPVKVTGNYPSHIEPVGGAENITVSLTVDAKSRRVLGAQMAGKESVSKRIDVFAAGITSEMSVDDLYMLDLSYAPLVSTVWDPINKISGKAILELSKRKF